MVTIQAAAKMKNNATAAPLDLGNLFIYYLPRVME
jgi:hypothetical protein